VRLLVDADDHGGSKDPCPQHEGRPHSLTVSFALSISALLSSKNSTTALWSDQAAATSAVEPALGGNAWPLCEAASDLMLRVGPGSHSALVGLAINVPSSLPRAFRAGALRTCPCRPQRVRTFRVRSVCIHAALNDELPHSLQVPAAGGPHHRCREAHKAT
jgi:hypothetical protein